jgi:hypothetical protein
VALQFPHRSLRELLAGRALASRLRRGGEQGDAVQTVLAEAAGDPGGWSQVVVHAVAVLSGHTLIAVRGVSAEQGRWEERAKVFERLPKRVGDAGKLVRVCVQYRQSLKPTHGADLFWLGWLLDPNRRWTAEGGVWCPIPPFEGVVGARPDE